MTTINELSAAFSARFGGVPRIFRAPGRVNLIGEHTDYNQGLAMPAAIDLAVWAAVGPREDRVIAVHSVNLDETREIDLDRIRHTPRGEWIDYVHGVALGLEHRGARIRGANLLVCSDLPLGAGLSSSAALEVSSALALADIAGVSIGPTELALLCQAAENDFVGARCGVMDQFIACHGRAGHAMRLDCRDLSYRFAPLPEGVRLVLANTMVQHDLTAGKYNRRRAECEQALERLRRVETGLRSLRDVTMEVLDEARETLSRTQYRRVRHVVTENARVLEAERVLDSGDAAGLGALLSASHASLRNDYDVSCHELNVMAELAEGAPGVHGARMMGGGFGGCVIAVVDADRADEPARAIGPKYEEMTGLKPWFHVCSIVDAAGPAA